MPTSKESCRLAVLVILWHPRWGTEERSRWLCPLLRDGHAKVENKDATGLEGFRRRGAATDDRRLWCLRFECHSGIYHYTMWTLEELERGMAGHLSSLAATPNKRDACHTAVFARQRDRWEDCSYPEKKGIQSNLPIRIGFIALIWSG
jgi:hypothetical protein